jgi:hypothetical protein
MARSFCSLYRRRQGVLQGNGKWYRRNPKICRSVQKETIEKVLDFTVLKINKLGGGGGGGGGGE